MPGSAAASLRRDRETFLIDSKRAGAVAGGEPDVADLVKTDGDISLPSGVVGIGGGEFAHDRKTFVRRGCCAGEIAERQISIDKFVEHRGAAALQAEIVWRCLREPVHQRPRRVEDFAHRFEPHAGDIPQTLREIEHHVVGRLLRDIEVTLCKVALFFRFLPRALGVFLPLNSERGLLLRNAALRLRLMPRLVRLEILPGRQTLPRCGNNDDRRRIP